MRNPDIAERREKVARIVAELREDALLLDQVPTRSIVENRLSKVDARHLDRAVASMNRAADDIEAFYSSGDGDEASFQDRVRPWMLECFGPVIPFDKIERGDRLLEEVFELLQSGDYDPARVLALRDYVWARAVGEPEQEAGGVMVTMAAYCLAFGLDMREAGETELARIWTKVEAIRAKQAAKPTGSALPIAAPSPMQPGSGEEKP